MRKTLFFVGLLAALASKATAGIPPEVPHTRASQVFSPFYFSFGDNGESVFESGGPACQAYRLSFDRKQLSDPELGVIAAVGVRSFLDILAARSGLMLTDSHGSSTQLGVEAFPPGPDGESAARSRMEFYETFQFVSPGELNVVELPETPAYWVITARPALIQRVLTEHSIVYIAACNSFGLRTSFVNDSHNTRGFVGFDDLCLRSQFFFDGQGLTVARRIFDNMAGVRNDSGFYSNIPLDAAVPLAQAIIPAVNKMLDSRSPPAAGNIRLYNAPRLIFSDITQDTEGNGSFSKRLYRYQFGGEYPYNPGDNSDYPGAPGEKGIAGTGPIRMTMRFSEPMDPAWSEFKVELRFSDGKTQAISGNWGSAVLPNDTWSAMASLPPDAADGHVTVAVRARKIQCSPGLDTNRHELDVTGSGGSIAGTFDTSQSFAIASPDSSTRTA